MQILVEDHGFLRNGLAILARMGRRLPPEPRVFRQPAGETRRYVLFDPFRGALTVHRGLPELRLEVNVPDDSLESWQEGKKTQAVKMGPPWLRLTLAPLLAAFFLAGLLVAAAALLFGPGPREGPVPDAPPASLAGWRAPALVFVAGTLFSAALFLGVFHAMPGFGDEMNYLMEGRIFAAGHLSVKEPAHPEFFRVGWMDMFGEDHRVWGFHPPGQAALLALGWLAGVPWLTVPLVFGGMLAATYLLARDVLGSHAWALANVLVVATSHYVLSLSSSYMAHAPSFLVLSLYLLFLLRFARTGRARFLLLAAACAGAAFCIRPMSAVLASLVPLPAALACARGKAKARTWALALAIGLAVSSLVFLYTWGITGRFTLPYSIKGPEVGLDGLGAAHEELGRARVEPLPQRERAPPPGPQLRPPRERRLLLRAARPRRGPPPQARRRPRPRVRDVRRVRRRPQRPPLVRLEVGAADALRRLVPLLPRDDRGPPAFRGPPSGRAPRRAAAAAAGRRLLFVAAVDLPWRFRTEYHDYNLAPCGVRDAIAKSGHPERGDLLRRREGVCCYTPYNAVTFDGDIVYAREQGELLDYLLLARFPQKEAWFTPDGNTLEKRPNFYRRDLATLKTDLAALGGGPATVVMPWADVAPTPLNDALKPAVPEEPGRFLARMASGARGSEAPFTAVFLEGATELARLADLTYETATPPVRGTYEGPIAFRTIGKRRPGAGDRLPGIRMTCREGTTWDGKLLSEQIVSTLDIGVCPGEFRSITFETSFELKAPRTCVFATESDDGSGVFVDGTLVVDNDLANTHGAETKSGTIALSPGVHNLVVKYFNGPGGARLNATLEDRSGKPVPISVAGFVDEFVFFVSVPKDAVHVR